MKPSLKSRPARAQARRRQGRSGFQGHQERPHPRLRREQSHRREPRQGSEIRTDRRNTRACRRNIILTDYLHFVWINKEGPQREMLCHADRSRKSKLPPARGSRRGRRQATARAFSRPRPKASAARSSLRWRLPTRSKLLRDYLGEELVRQEREHKEGRLYGLFQIFRDQVFHELTLKEFADAFAQMLAYGLFLARLNSDSEAVTLHNAREYVPGSFRLIRELVDFLTELGEGRISRHPLGGRRGAVHRQRARTCRPSTRICRSGSARRSAARCGRRTRKSIACSSAIPSSISTRIT